MVGERPCPGGTLHIIVNVKLHPGIPIFVQPCESRLGEGAGFSNGFKQRSVHVFFGEDWGNRGKAEVVR